jgi:hypothetical protein
LPSSGLATSVDQLVTLLLANYARQFAKALPCDRAYARLGKTHGVRV